MSLLPSKPDRVQRIARTILALFFVLWHSSIALAVYSEAMVNEPVRSGTRFATTLQVGLGSACLISVLILIGVIAGWRGRTLLILGIVQACVWWLTVLLI